MPGTILITQCLQRDFVEPVRVFDPLPNRLHVGHEEALRLLGPDPRAGPLTQLMRWARAQDPEQLAIVHIRDWHDPASPEQREHLRSFGAHCLRGSPGAAFVFDAEDAAAPAPNEHIVDATGLNDVESTDLAERLREIAGGQPLRVGVIGVWTEAKVSYLLYDLATRLGVRELATSSALTASSSRAQHFIALDQLRRLLGVTVLDSVSAFVDWLRPGAILDARHLPPRLGPALDLQSDAPLDPEDRQVVDHLYRESATVSLTPLAGGFSGARVYRVQSTDALARRQASTVLKLGPARLVGSERAAFERVQEVLGNYAPVLRGFVDIGARAGIKYAYAAMGDGAVRTLKSLVEGDTPTPRIARMLDTVFGEILEPFYAAARYEQLPLLDYYGFRAFYRSARPAAEAVVGGPISGAELTVPGGFRAWNLLRFYEELLPVHADAPGESHYVSTAHGDLNGANILLDGRDNIWVIDFAHTSANHHVLRDLAKLENDLLYLMTPVPDDAALHQGLLITEALGRVQDLAAPLPERVDGLENPKMLRTWEVIRVLRAHAARLVREDRHPLQMDLALLRYAVHTLTFDEADTMQRRWALLAACGQAERADTALRAERRLRVDWLDPDALRLPGALGLTICPGRRDRGHSVASDTAALAEAGVHRLITLIGDDELESVGAEGLGGALEARQIGWTQLPILDQGVPALTEARALVAGIEASLQRGERVVVHCMGGLGRSGTIAACLLVRRGLSPADAIASVRRSRDPRCVETAQQESFVARFALA